MMTMMSMMMTMMTMMMTMMTVMSMMNIAEELAVKGLAAQNHDTNDKTRRKKKKKSNDERTVNDRDEVREKSQVNTKDDTGQDKPQEKTHNQKRDLETERMQQVPIGDGEFDNEHLENDLSGLNNGCRGYVTDKGAPNDETSSGTKDISKNLKKELHGYSCNLCGKKCSDLSKAKSHIEAKHFPSSTGYICSCCHQWFKTKNALSIHMSREHRNKK